MRQSRSREVPRPIKVLIVFTHLSRSRLLENPVITILDAIENVADLLLTRKDVRIEQTSSDLIIQSMI